MDPLLVEILDLAHEAGKEILGFYQSELKVEKKEDDSPVTAADRAAHAVIQEGLKDLTPALPVLSEEGELPDAATRKGWNHYWLVDPLDGTKEFLDETDDFTVNIALIEEGRPIAGVVHAPAHALSWVGGRGDHAYRQEGFAEPEPIKARTADPKKLVIPVTRNHGGPKLKAMLSKIPGVDIRPMGSALKFGLVAAGEADLYVRFGPTMEWDTAAAHAVVEAAGGQVLDLEGNPLAYNKESLENPSFICLGDPKLDWKALLPELPPA